MLLFIFFTFSLWVLVNGEGRSFLCSHTYFAIVMHEELEELLTFFYFFKATPALVRTVSVGLAQKLDYFSSCSFLNPFIHPTPPPTLYIF